MFWMSRKKKREQIEELREKICDDRCKYVDKANEVLTEMDINSHGGVELMEEIFERLDVYCMQCPMNELMKKI